MNTARILVSLLAVVTLWSAAEAAPRARSLADTILNELLDLRPDGSFWLNLACFNFLRGTTMTNERFHQLFGGPPRQPEEPIERRHMDVAAHDHSRREPGLSRCALVIGHRRVEPQRELRRRAEAKRLRQLVA